MPCAIVSMGAPRRCGILGRNGRISMSRFASGLKTGLAVIGGLAVIIVVLAFAADRLGFIHFWGGTPATTQEASAVNSPPQQIPLDEVNRKLADKSITGDERARLSFLKGEYARKDADIDGAIAAYSEAIRLAPGFLPAYFGRGTILFNQADFDDAAADFSKSLELKPGLPIALERRALSYAMLGRMSEASADIDALPDLNPYDSHGYASRAAIYDMIGNSDRALIFYANAINVDPSDPMVYANRALTYGNMGDYPHAYADFATAMKMAPKEPFSYSRLGLTQVSAGQYAEAVGNYEKAISLSVGAPDAYDVIWLHLAHARAKQEDHDELFANAARLDQSQWPYPVISYYLGDIKANAVLKVAEDSKELCNICEANFYVGYVSLIEGRVADAKASFQNVIKRCHPGFIELQGARLELARMAAK